MIKYVCPCVCHFADLCITVVCIMQKHYSIAWCRHTLVTPSKGVTMPPEKEDQDTCNTACKALGCHKEGTTQK